MVSLHRDKTSKKDTMTFRGLKRSMNRKKSMTRIVLGRKANMRTNVEMSFNPGMN